MRALNGYERTAKAWKDKKEQDKEHKSERVRKEQFQQMPLYPHVPMDADGKENEGRRYQSENKMSQFDLQQLH